MSTVARRPSNGRSDRMSGRLTAGEKPHRTPGQRARSAWSKNAGSNRLYEQRDALQAALAIFEADLDHQADTLDPRRGDTIKRIRVTKHTLSVIEREIATLEGRA